MELRTSVIGVILREADSALCPWSYLEKCISAVAREAADLSDVGFLPFESEAPMIEFAVPSGGVDLSPGAFAFAFACPAAKSASSGHTMEQPASIACLAALIAGRPLFPGGGILFSPQRLALLSPPPIHTDIMP